MDSLYFMRNGDANVVKIGRARDPQLRRGQFKTGNPEEMTVVDVVEAEDARPIETLLHRIHYSKRLRGEFYDLTPAEQEAAGQQAREIRDHYLPLQLEAKRLAQSACDAPSRPPTDEDRLRYRALIEAREAKYVAEFMCDFAEYAYKVAIETSEGIEGQSNWGTQMIARFDEAAFKRLHPELHAAFTRPVPQRTLRLLWS